MFECKIDCLLKGKMYLKKIRKLKKNEINKQKKMFNLFFYNSNINQSSNFLINSRKLFFKQKKNNIANY